ncbi:Endonuclease/exonuclease/phosphatase [Dimargaris cristalligena]|uniref:sphingomyelin phosphodiesterase n=1 Tax=Dimargaris cristalligena TaxID=215637 RepID=A0A4P9ZNT0_9FUNG|nr:Endonuclease/exonuclease/phosphatase [Dimargaris cristalligena]|eukprot:RKP34845.1 Endonuclease/exonuclease/phosphatase [Dimargaris cristalligena]
MSWVLTSDAMEDSPVIPANNAATTMGTTPTAASATAHTQSIRILTINLFIRPPGIKTNASDFKDARVQYVIDHVLPNYDVVCFQELFAFGSDRRARIIQAARQLGYTHWYGSREQSLWNLAIDGGLLTISRLPIVQTDAIRYPRGKYSDWLAAKGAIYTRIALQPTLHLHLFTTHTQASYAPVLSLNDPTVVIRRKQFLMLHHFIRTKTQSRPAGEPVLLLGDLNVDARVHDGTTENLTDTRSSEEYAAMLTILRGGGYDGPPGNANGRSPGASDLSLAPPLPFRDLVFDMLGYHPVTFGDVKVAEDGNLTPRDTVLTGSEAHCSCQRLDYALWIDGRATHGASPRSNGKGPDDSTDSDSLKSSYSTPPPASTTVIKPQRAIIVPILTEEIHPSDYFHQISDHYGVGVELDVTLPSGNASPTE